MPTASLTQAKDSHLVNIGLDDESGGYQMVKYLLECGYEHIKVCAGRDNGVDHLRYVGAQRAMRRSVQAEGQKLQFVALGMNYEKRKASYDVAGTEKIAGNGPVFPLRYVCTGSDQLLSAAVEVNRSRRRSEWQATTTSAMRNFPCRGLLPSSQNVQKKAQKAVEIPLQRIGECEEYPQREVELSVTLEKRKSVERD